MLIKDIIEHLQYHSPWVDYDKTRDIVLIGNIDKEVQKVALCWVATMKVINECIEKDIHFIITHENFLYSESTSPYRHIKETRDLKLKLCNDNNITVYRCHDAWDQFPKYGIADSLSKIIDIDFDKRPINSFYQYATIKNMTVKDIATKVASALKVHGCDYVEILGNPSQTVTRLGMGVGAETNIQKMIKEKIDCAIISDDGITNWIDMQWSLDNNLPCIICHHSINEMEGMLGMEEYLSKEFKNCKFIKLNEGYDFTLIKGE